MKGVVGVALFAGGIAVGFLAANIIMKKHYEGIADEEINSMKEYYKTREDEKDENEGQLEIIDEEEADEEEMEEIINEYTTEHEETVPFVKSEYEMDEETEASLMKEHPYLIEPDEFGDGVFDYDLETLYYHTDGVLANQADEVIENWVSVIGNIDLSRFDLHDEDDDGLIYIRNDNTKHDYEIQKEKFSYAESMAGIGWDS